MRAFNLAYADRPGARGQRRVHYDPFLYPLDAIDGWNRLYGRRGFFQHQSVVPLDGRARRGADAAELDRGAPARFIPRRAEAVRRRAVARPAVLPHGGRDLRARSAQPRRTRRAKLLPA